MESTYNNKGGIYGHYLRRLIHIAMAILPWLYYWHGSTTSHYLGMPRYEICLILLLFVFIFELIRLHKQWVLFGQRSYEANILSAVAWGSLGIVIVLLGSPEIGIKGAALGLPLIWSLAFVDPLLGELRLWKQSLGLQLSIGWLALVIIWGLSYFYLQTPILLVFITPPIMLLAEQIRLTKIDDNFLMLIIPWLFIMFLYHYPSF